MPHPLEHKFVLKVQTEKPLTPAQALEKTVDRLIGDLASLEERVRVIEGLFMVCCLKINFYRMKLKKFPARNPLVLGNRIIKFNLVIYLLN